jgi:hypothetical protein
MAPPIAAERPVSISPWLKPICGTSSLGSASAGFALDIAARASAEAI